MFNFPVVVVTDASYCQHTHQAAYAAVIKPHTQMAMKFSGAFDNELSGSSQAEELAIRTALIQVRRLGINNIVVYSDCLGAIRKLNSRPVSKRLCIQYKHVKGHSNSGSFIAGLNRWCDQRSRQILKEMRQRSGYYD